jgi:proteasome lid subunit RPN8/RPN11
MLTISPDVDRAIRRHGEETFPYECCGALIGRTVEANAAEGGRDGERRLLVDTVVPLPNTTEEGPRRRFLVRPSDYRHADRRATELGAELLGFYHSHPDHPARPSQYDLDHAWPTFAYVIVSVMSGAAADMTVWFLKDDRSTFEEGTLHHGENPHPDTAAAVHR